MWRCGRASASAPSAPVSSKSGLPSRGFLGRVCCRCSGWPLAPPECASHVTRTCAQPRNSRGPTPSHRQTIPTEQREARTGRRGKKREEARLPLLSPQSAPHTHEYKYGWGTYRPPRSKIRFCVWACGPVWCSVERSTGTTGGRWKGRVSAESMQGQALVGSCGQTEEDRSRVARVCGRTEERDARRRQPQPSRSRAASELVGAIDAGGCRTPGSVNTPRERTMPRRRHTRTGATSIKQWLSTYASRAHSFF